MEARDIYANLSPLDHRYWLSNPDIFESLSSYLSERAAIRYCARAEIALVESHLAERGQSDSALFSELEKIADALDPSEVQAEEEKTRHNIRALVNVLKRHVPEKVSALVHLGATSVDILDTANAARIRDAVLDIALPLAATLVREIASMTVREASTPQVGRTHGQHAVPITFGWTMAEYASRLGKCVPRIENAAADLRGKLAGATGSYNALAMICPDPEKMERDYLSRLGLEPSEHSTQLVEPEHLLRLLLEMNVAFGVVANLADDFRNLQRSEIDEIRESFGSDQVGSSTMPQKRNPWSSEHVKSLWKAFFPRVTTFFMDQISEHQRDLTNSASERFVVDYIAGFCAAFNRMLKVVRSVKVNAKKMADNIAMSSGGVLAEPAYILLAESGDTDAHETVRKLTLEAERDSVPFSAVLARYPEIAAKLESRLESLGYEDAPAFFGNPESYNGISAEKSKAIGEKYIREVDAYFTRSGKKPY